MWDSVLSVCQEVMHFSEFVNTPYIEAQIMSTCSACRMGTLLINGECSLNAAHTG